MKQSGTVKTSARCYQVVKRSSFVHEVGSLDSSGVFSVRVILKHAAYILIKGNGGKRTMKLRAAADNLPAPHYCTACTLSATDTNTR